MLKLFRKNINKNRKKGFTLIELVVNMSIVGIIMVIVTTLTTTSINSFHRQQDKLDAVAVSNVIFSTIKNKVQSVHEVKMDTFFTEKFKPIYNDKGDFIEYSTIVIDQTGDSTPDYISRDNKTHEVVMCYQEMLDYNGLFVLQNDHNKSNIDRHNATGAARKGKLYMIKRSEPDNPYIFHKKADIINSENNSVLAPNILGYTENIVMIPLIDDDLYRGYDVDVRFKYLMKTEVLPDGATPTPPNSESAKQFDNYLKDCFRIEIDVYKDDNCVYSTSDTISFIQPTFSLKQSRVGAPLDEYKEVLMFK